MLHDAGNSTVWQSGGLSKPHSPGSRTYGGCSFSFYGQLLGLSAPAVTDSSRPGWDWITSASWAIYPTVVSGDAVKSQYLASGSDGRVTFSVYTAQGTFASITSANALNDGQWHLITATEGSSGTALYIDGRVSATTTARTNPGNNYTGHWRLGAEVLGGWPSASGSSSFAGDVDEWAIYPTAISPATIANLYAARSAG